MTRRLAVDELSQITGQNPLSDGQFQANRPRDVTAFTNQLIAPQVPSDSFEREIIFAALSGAIVGGLYGLIFAGLMDMLTPFGPEVGPGLTVGQRCVLYPAGALCGGAVGAFALGFCVLIILTLVEAIEAVGGYLRQLRSTDDGENE
jgi:hypothetical protein